jgi:hypothetical protein
MSFAYADLNSTQLRLLSCLNRAAYNSHRLITTNPRAVLEQGQSASAVPSAGALALALLLNMVMSNTGGIS